LKRVVVLAAIPEEFVDSINSRYNVVYTGVGKINAARVTTQVILEMKPQLIVNIGTVGSVWKELTGVVSIKEVIERDMDAFPLSKRGVTPFDTISPKLSSDIGELTCATGDSFVREVDPWLIQEGVAVVDMELFAIAKVCASFGINWRSCKLVSDYLNEDSSIDWKNSLEQSTFELSKALDSICNME
jgi:adenosylhomocysteine nucleosidase